MASLVDTNILLRASQPSHTLYSTANRAVQVLLNSGELVFISVQNVAEFWNAATRPVERNGFGLTHERAIEEIRRLETVFVIASESLESYEVWKKLVFTHRVTGAQVHDARLVSVMMTYGITQIVTFNVKDFMRFPGIEAIHPDDVR